MKYILILVLLFIAAVSSCQKSDQTKIIVVTQDRILIERIYYTTENEKKQLISKVYLNGINHPLDSIRFIRNETNNIIAKDVYQYKEGVYEKQITGSGSFSDTECVILSRITKPKFYLRDLSDICTITTATLPVGGTVADKIKTLNDGDITIIYAEDINARFRGLSLEIASFFYDQILHSFSLQIQNEKLLTEKYVFEEGTLQRTYSYDADKLIVTIKADYKNGEKEIRNKEYLIL